MPSTTLPRTARIGRTRKFSAALVATASCAAAVALASPSQAATPAGHVAAAGHLQVTAVAKQAHTAKQAAAPKGNQQYGNNLDGWIRQSLDIMKAKGIPGSYEGLHRNIMRESSGNPNAVNGYDVNAANGVPSKGLLQVIQPTFDSYHVAGTAKNLTDPVANITAAANYAADKYGSIDKVNSAY